MYIRKYTSGEFGENEDLLGVYNSSVLYSQPIPILNKPQEVQIKQLPSYYP